MGVILLKKSWKLNGLAKSTTKSTGWFKNKTQSSTASDSPNNQTTRFGCFFLLIG